LGNNITRISSLPRHTI